MGLTAPQVLQCGEALVFEEATDAALAEESRAVTHGDGSSGLCWRLDDMGFGGALALGTVTVTRGRFLCHRRGV